MQDSPYMLRSATRRSWQGLVGTVRSRKDGDRIRTYVLATSRSKLLDESRQAKSIQFNIIAVPKNRRGDECASCFISKNQGRREPRRLL
jgi:hypothetical protein